MKGNDDYIQSLMALALRTEVSLKYDIELVLSDCCKASGTVILLRLVARCIRGGFDSGKLPFTQALYRWFSEESFEVAA